MNKRFYAICSLLLLSGSVLSYNATAQSGEVGIGTVNPDPSSALEIASTSKGVLIPRMTERDRDNIGSPALGLLIYQTDKTTGFYYYANGWQPLGGGSGGNGGANTALSNLSSTSINTDLLPNGNSLHNLGSSGLSWKDIHFWGDINYQGTRFISSRSTNLFFGSSAGNAGVTGNFNTALGHSALMANVGGFWNTAVGNQALTNTNGSYGNTGIGFQSMIANISGNDNTSVGVLALSANNTGSGNSAHGVSSLRNIAGSYNTGLGHSSGTNVPSGNNNTFLGAFADGPGGFLTNATAIGYQASVTASNTIRVGNTAISSIGGNVGWSTLSDGRFKKNVQENVPGLQFINQLRPVTYTIDVETLDKKLRPVAVKQESKSDYPAAKPLTTPEDLKSKQDKAGTIYSGFIAQEVEATAKKLGYNFSGVDAPKTTTDLYGLRYAEFVVPLVKAVQELNKKVEGLQTDKTRLNGTNRELDQLISKQQEQLNTQQKQINEMKAMIEDMRKQLQTVTSSTKK